MILDEPAVFALADCIGCGRLFEFDPQTGLPPDLCSCTDRAACLTRSVREPVCRPCRLRANPYRATHGLPLWPVNHD